MKVEQIYTGCLAEAAYYIESEGEAVIIDPLRETKPYLDKLEKEGRKLKYIFETHFHADFVDPEKHSSNKETDPFAPLVDLKRSQVDVARVYCRQSIKKQFFPSKHARACRDTSPKRQNEEKMLPEAVTGQISHT